MDLNCLAYWYPKLKAAGLPTPVTELVHASRETLQDIYRIFEGQPTTAVCEPFFATLHAAAERIGYPLFLRSGHTSGKHNWQNTCYVKRAHDLKEHLLSIVEYSELVSVCGLPCEWWAIRELLPTKMLAYAPEFGHMPICREFRAFVSDAAVECIHPYWSAIMLEKGGVPEARKVAESLSRTEDLSYLRELASRAGAAVRGEWSVDMLDTERGWFITDMAVAGASYHLSDCPNSKPRKQNYPPSTAPMVHVPARRPDNENLLDAPSS